MYNGWQIISLNLSVSREWSLSQQSEQHAVVYFTERVSANKLYFPQANIITIRGINIISWKQAGSNLKLLSYSRKASLFLLQEIKFNFTYTIQGSR